MKNNKYLVPILFFGVLLLAAILRLWVLGSVPASLNWDEASWGYNALAFVETGKDEFGKSFPIVLQSFDDYKPALYLYLIAPFVYLFGLSDFIVRFPSAFSGILAVALTYFLVKELFNGRKDIALLSSFLLAVSPWAIQFSRAAFESNVGLLLNLLLIITFLKSLKKHKYIFLSALFAGLSLYAYQVEKIFVPLIILVLIISLYKEFIKIPRRYILGSILIGFMVALPMLLTIFSTPESLSRAKGTSIFSGPEVLNVEFYPERDIVNTENDNYIGKIIDNRRILYTKAIIGNYLSHFDPNYLFINGEWNIKRHQPPYMGHLYLIELPFLLMGLYFFIFGRFKRGTKIFVLLWILVAPVAAAFTWDVPNSVRTLNILPSLQIVVGIGVIGFWSWLMNLKMNKIIKYAAVFVLILLALFNFSYYINHYFVQYNFYDSKSWQYGYKELVQYVDSVSVDYEKVYVSESKNMDESYIFFLYNLEYNPAEYQKNPNKNFLNYEFIDTEDFDVEKLYKNELLVIPANQFSEDFRHNVLTKIRYKNGEDAYVVLRGSK